MGTCDEPCLTDGRNTDDVIVDPTTLKVQVST